MLLVTHRNRTDNMDAVARLRAPNEQGVAFQGAAWRTHVYVLEAAAGLEWLPFAVHL